MRQRRRSLLGWRGLSCRVAVLNEMTLRQFASWLDTHSDTTHSIIKNCIAWLQKEYVRQMHSFILSHEDGKITRVVGVVVIYEQWRTEKDTRVSVGFVGQHATFEDDVSAGDQLSIVTALLGGVPFAGHNDPTGFRGMSMLSRLTALVSFRLQHQQCSRGGDLRAIP